MRKDTLKLVLIGEWFNMTNTKQLDQEIKEKVNRLREILISNKVISKLNWTDKDLIIMALDIEIKRLTQ